MSFFKDQRIDDSRRELLAGLSFSRVSGRRQRHRQHERCPMAQHRSCRSTFPLQPTLRRTATNPGLQTHAVVCYDQREARHCWFKQPAGARARFLTVSQSSYTDLRLTSHRGHSVSAASESNPQAMHRPLLRSSLLPATHSRPRSCLCQFRTTP